MAAAIIARPRGWRSLMYTSNQVRQISDQVHHNMTEKKAFMVDNLSLVRKLEKHGVQSEHAEGIVKVVNDSLENLSHYIVSKEEMKMEHYFSSLRLEVERMQIKLSSNIEKMQMDNEKMQSKVISNIEKMLMDNEKLQSKFSSDFEKLQRNVSVDIEKLRSGIVAVKYDFIKYFIASVVSISGVGFTCIKLWMH